MKMGKEMKSSDNSSRSVASSIKQTSRKDHSQSVDREDESWKSTDKVLCDVVLDDSKRGDHTPKDASFSHLPNNEHDEDSSVMQKLKPMLKLFFEHDRESKSNISSPKRSSQETGTIQSSKDSARPSGEDDSKWKYYRRDTLSSIESLDPFPFNLRRRSSLGVVKGTDVDEPKVNSKSSTHRERCDNAKADASSREEVVAEQKAPWYKRKIYLVPACALFLIIFCLVSASSLVKGKTNATSSGNTNISYNQQAEEGGNTVSAPQPTKHKQPTKQPTGSAAFDYKSPTYAPVVNVKPTAVSVSVPTGAKAPTKSPVTPPTNPVTPTAAAADINECFITVSIYSSINFPNC
jgi:hypothetical protein